KDARSHRVSRYRARRFGIKRAGMIRENKIHRAFHIGELAKRVGRSVHAIRWYERQGLLPGVLRDAGGRRIYNDRHIVWLELVHRLRLTGMSVARMREYTALIADGRGSLKQQRELLRSHRATVAQTIVEWNEALNLLDRKLRFYDEWIATAKRPNEELAAN